MTGQEISKINDKLKADRSLWDSVWQDIADYIVFRKNSIVGVIPAGSKVTQKMFDSTATLAAENLAAWIDSNLTSMGMEWFSLKIGRGFGENKEVQEWLEACKKIQYDALRASNFSGQWHEVLNDLTTFCTGALYVEEKEVKKAGFNGLNFIAMPPGTYTHAEGRDGISTALFREFEVPAQEALEKWPDKVGDEIKKDAEKDSSKLYKFIHAVFPKTWYGGKHKTKMEFVSYYVDYSKRTIMQEGGFDDFRFFVIPWLKQSGESYGRGPGWTALPDIKTLHRVKELALSEWALCIRPPLAVLDNGVIGSVRWTPAGITVVSKLDAVKPILTGAKFSDNRVREEDLRNQIKEVFHGDKVQFIPPRQETGQMTAYEVSKRYELAQALLGPTFGNIVAHGLNPIVETTFNMMFRAGAFPQPPAALSQMAGMGGDQVRIEYESPLARAQRGQDVDAINRTIQDVAPLAQAKPDIWDNFDFDATAVHIGEVRGIPAKLLTSEKDKKAKRAARAQAEMARQQLEQAQQGAAAAKDIAGAAKDMPPDAMAKMAEMAGKMGA